MNKVDWWESQFLRKVIDKKGELDIGQARTDGQKYRWLLFIATENIRMKHKDLKTSLLI